MPNTREKLEVIAHLGDHITYKEDIGICYDSELAKVIEDAYMTLKSGVTIQKWIPVTERLPETTCLNLALIGELPFLAYYDGKRWRSSGTLRVLNITHWMPLPEPPKEVE